MATCVRQMYSLESLGVRYSVELQLDGVDFLFNIESSDIMKAFSQGFYPPLASSPVKHEQWHH